MAWSEEGLGDLAGFEPLANQININRESDFDNQTPTDIILTPGKFYKIGASFSTSKNFTGENSVISGLNSATTITFTGSGSMFKSTNGVFRINDIFIDCPGNTAFECIGDDTGNVSHRINADSVLVIRCAKLLESTGVGAQVFDLVQVGALSGPVAISFAGTFPAIVFNFSRVAVFGMTAGSIGFDLGTTIVQEVELANVILSGDPTGHAISALPNSGNITVGNLGMVDNCNFSDFTTQLVGVKFDDNRWIFNGNALIENTMNIGMTSVNNNVTPTVVGFIDTPVKMVGAFTNQEDSRFSDDGAGRLTFTSEIAAKLDIDARVTVLSASGGLDKQNSAYIAINGVPILDTGDQGTVTATKAASLGMIWAHDFITGDYVEVFLENNTDGVDVIGKQSVLRIR